MNTEEVIVECLRNNMQLCESAVPRDLVEDLGTLLDQEPVRGRTHSMPGKGERVGRRDALGWKKGHASLCAFMTHQKQ